MIFVIGLWTFLRALVFGSATIALENPALRHQLLVLQRSVGRPRLARWDRILWVWLSRLWTGWRSSLIIVQPATVRAWHRQGFQLYWRWRSTANRVGRPRLDAEIRRLIRRMARENPTWGRRRIQAELALLGYEVAELTVAKYMHRTSPRPSPTWRAFLTAHARELVAIDFFVVPTLTFRLLFVFVVLRHQPPGTDPLQCHRSPHGRLDGPPNHRGVPGGDRPEVPPSGSRLDLRRGLHPVRQHHGNPAGTHGPQSALAEPLRRAGHRLHPPRVPRSFPHSARGPSPSTAARLPHLLQHRPSPPSARTKLSTTPRCQPPALGARGGDPARWRASSPLPARGLIADAPPVNPHSFAVLTMTVRASVTVEPLDRAGGPPRRP